MATSASEVPKERVWTYPVGNILVNVGIQQGLIPQLKLTEGQLDQMCRALSDYGWESVELGDGQFLDVECPIKMITFEPRERTLYGYKETSQGLKGLSVKWDYPDVTLVDVGPTELTSSKPVPVVSNDIGSSAGLLYDSETLNEIRRKCGLPLIEK